MKSSLKSTNVGASKLPMFANRLFRVSSTAVLLGATVLAGCGQSDNGAAGGDTDSGAPNTTASGTGMKLTGAGATFPYPIYAKWFDTYNKAKGVQINYQSIGSGAGIKQLKNGTVDFGASDAALSDEDLKEMPGETLHIPTVAGAVVVGYNLPGVEKGLKLSGDVLANIFLGEIKKWNDPAITAINPDVKLPDLAIAVAHRSDGSGTTNIFTNYLKAVSPEWSSKVGAGKSVDWPVGLGGKGNAGVAGIIKQTPGGLGYIELAYAEQNDLPYASIKNKAGQFVAPSVESTTAAATGALAAVQKDIRAPIVNAVGENAYPIAGFTYILVYKKQKDVEKGAALKEFLKWAITEGQSQAKDLMYAPLPAEVVALNEKTIDSVQ